jgi:hypothetical protein
VEASLFAILFCGIGVAFGGIRIRDGDEK